MHTPALNTPMLSHSGLNLAPLKPLTELRDGNKKHESSLQRAIKEKYDACMKYEKSTWDELISMGQMTAFFMQGKQLLMKKPYGPGYYIRQVASDDGFRQSAMNLMGFYAQCCTSKMMASSPNVVVRAGSDDPRAIASAQAARSLVDYYEGKFYTAKFKWRQSLHALQNGVYLHRVFYDPNLPGPSAQKKQLNQADFQLGKGYGQCYECGFSHEDASAFQAALPYGEQCPECGGYSVDVQKVQPQALQTVTQGEQVQYGDLSIAQMPFPACRWDLSRDAEVSSWFIYRQRIPPGLIKMFLGDAVIPDTSSSDDKSLDALHALAYSGQAFEGRSSQDAYKREHDKRPTLCEFWLSPEDYADVQLEGGLTISGQEIPAGRMSDSFKRPVCAVSLNDASLVIGLFEEKHRDQIVSGHWFMEADSGAGRGMQDSVAVQKRFNAVDGVLYQGMASTATPAVLHDSRLLKQDQVEYLFTPRKNIDINLGMLPPNMKLQDAYYLGNPGSVSNQLIGYGQTLSKDMFQLSSLVVQFTDGLQGVNNKTATGAQIADALANSLFGPMLMVNGGVCKRIAEIVVELTRKHIPVARFFPGGEGKRAGRYLSGADISHDLVFEVKQDSELPVTPFTRQTDFTAMVQGLGGTQGIVMLKQQAPDIFRHALSIYNVRIETEDADTISTLCQTRLEQIESNASAGVADPGVLIQSLQPPVAFEEPKHTEKQAWWSDYLDTPEGQEAESSIRAAAQGMFRLHQQYANGIQSQNAFNQGVVQTTGAAPSALAQNMMSQATDTSEEQAYNQQQAQAAEQGQQAQQAAEQRGHEVNLKGMELESRERIARMAQNRKQAA